VTSTVTAAPMAATAATCHSHRGGKEKRDHGDEDAAAAHGSLHRRSVARHGARRGVYRKHQKWASGSEIELVRLSRLRSGAAGGGFRAMMEAHRFSSSVMSFRGEAVRPDFPGGGSGVSAGFGGPHVQHEQSVLARPPTM